MTIYCLTWALFTVLHTALRLAHTVGLLIANIKGYFFHRPWVDWFKQGFLKFLKLYYMFF